MAELFLVPENGTKEDIYQSTLQQISSVIEQECNLIANLANIAAMLNTAFKHLWTGFYLRDGEDSLVLGPFQGPLACTRIPLKPVARGVCGAAASEKRTQIVPDVEKFSGHIACSSDARSEIVVPLIDNNDVVQLVLDIDSTELGTYDEIDKKYCEKLIAMIKDKHFSS